jgi:hypothetical protein
VDGEAAKLGLLIGAQAAGIIARCAGGLPRRVKLLLDNLQRLYPDDNRSQLGVLKVRQYLQFAGYDDERGLSPDEQAYLSALAARGTVSLLTLAALLGVDAKYARSQVEARSSSETSWRSNTVPAAGSRKPGRNCCPAPPPAPMRRTRRLSGDEGRGGRRRPRGAVGGGRRRP